MRQDPEIYVVQKIVGERADTKNRGKLEYLVEWVGWKGQNTWEPEAHLKDGERAQDAIDRWVQERAPSCTPQAKKKRKRKKT